MNPFGGWQFSLHTLVIAASLVYFWGTFDWKSINPTVRLRLLSVLGLLITAALMLLAIWPSAYSIPAIMSLPGFFAFGVAIFWPAAIWQRSRLRIYLNFCVIASGLCWIVQIYWELTTYVR